MSKFFEKFKSKRIGDQNIVSFTCSDSALEELLILLNRLKQLGDLGSSRRIFIEDFEGIIFFDGDGRDRLDNINVNGKPLKEWLTKEKETTNYVKKIERELKNEEKKNDSECN